MADERIKIRGHHLDVIVWEYGTNYTDMYAAMSRYESRRKEIEERKKFYALLYSDPLLFLKKSASALTRYVSDFGELTLDVGRIIKRGGIKDLFMLQSFPKHLDYDGYNGTTREKITNFLREFINMPDDTPFEIVAGEGDNICQLCRFYDNNENQCRPPTLKVIDAYYDEKAAKSHGFKIGEVRTVGELRNYIKTKLKTTADKSAAVN